MRRPTLLCGSVRPLDQDSDEGAYLYRAAPDKPDKGPDKPVKGPDKPVKGPDKPVNGPDKPVKGPDKPVKGPDKGADKAPEKAVAKAQAAPGRLSRVRRLLADSLLLGGRRRARAAAGLELEPAAPRLFGVPFGTLEHDKEGVPLLVIRICTYLENNGLHCEGLFQLSAENCKLAEELRVTLDFEGANDVFTTALLLQLWLKELPEPIVWSHVAAELLATHSATCEQPVTNWRQAIRLVLCTLPETNLRLLRFIFRFLHRYNNHQEQLTSKHGLVLNHLGCVFAPVIVLHGLEYCGKEQVSLARSVTSRLIQDHASVFHQWLLDLPYDDSSPKKKSSPSSGKKHHHRASCNKRLDPSGNSKCGCHRKRKERNESSNSSLSLERKVIRSSSEERHFELKVPDNKNENIRRVNSHEDFSGVNRHNKTSGNKNRFATVVESSHQSQNMHPGILPLQECNHTELSSQSKDVQSLGQSSMYDSGSKHKENEELHQPARDRDHLNTEHEDEHERRRKSERFSRSLVPSRAGARRNIGRKIHAQQSSSRSPSNVANVSSRSKKVNNTPQSISQKNIPKADLKQQNENSWLLDEKDQDSDDENESLSDDSRPGSSHSFLQLHPPERERSPSPSISPCTPPLDLTTLHKSVDGNEPVASRVSWDLMRPQGAEPSRGVLLSPRNSVLLTRRVFMDHNIPPSPPGEHHGSCALGPAQDLEDVVKKINKQIASIKKKLKRYEEGFEQEFGYRPSQADKMANKDIKKMCMDLSRARKELNEIKENPLSAIASQSDRHGLLSPSDGSTSFNIVSGSIGDTVVEVERRLNDKRHYAERPECIDDMTSEQQAAEKLDMQKSLLMLEKICGRATSKQDREIVRPLYDRYRQLKRIVARANSSKLKDSITELATIHEHEAMDFTPSMSLSIMPGSDADSNMPCSSQSGDKSSTISAVSSCAENVGLQYQSSNEETSDSQTSSSDSLGENLHALPLSDLVLQLTQVREEKKILRRLLREQEVLFQQQTGRRMQREDRIVAAASDVKEYSVVHASYKQIKAKLRLLEALIAKQRSLN